MLNFAEQTGSGAVTVIWSFPLRKEKLDYINPSLPLIRLHREIHKIKGNAAKGGKWGRGKGKGEREKGKPRGREGEC